jgi:hypothetical protein
MLETCYCLELRTFLDKNKFFGHSGNHQDRCLACVNSIIEAKNELVKQNSFLLEQLAKSKLTGVEGKEG